MTDEFITVNVWIDVPPVDPMWLVRYMFDQDHWIEVWPDARERWTWLRWMQRCGWDRRGDFLSPRFRHADGNQWRVLADDATPGQVAEVAARLAGRGQVLC